MLLNRDKESYREGRISYQELGSLRCETSVFRVPNRSTVRATGSMGGMSPMQAASTCSVCSAYAPYPRTAEGATCARDTGQAVISNVPLRRLSMVFPSLRVCSGAPPRMVGIGDDWNSSEGANSAAWSGDGMTIIGVRLYLKGRSQRQL